MSFLKIWTSADEGSLDVEEGSTGKSISVSSALRISFSTSF